jgi:hypothetical protein
MSAIFRCESLRAAKPERRHRDGAESSVGGLSAAPRFPGRDRREAFGRHAILIFVSSLLNAPVFFWRQ